MFVDSNLGPHLSMINNRQNRVEQINIIFSFCHSHNWMEEMFPLHKNLSIYYLFIKISCVDVAEVHVQHAAVVRQ